MPGPPTPSHFSHLPPRHLVDPFALLHFVALLAVRAREQVVDPFAGFVTQSRPANQSAAHRARTTTTPNQNTAAHNRRAHNGHLYGLRIGHPFVILRTRSGTPQPVHRNFKGPCTVQSVTAQTSEPPTGRAAWSTCSTWSEPWSPSRRIRTT